GGRGGGGGVGEGGGLVEGEPAHAHEVLDRRLAAERLELLARHAITPFGLVTEREQRLLATGLGTGASDLQYFVGSQVRAFAPPRRGRAPAVVADVAAERRERDEDLRRVRDDALAALAQLLRRTEQVGNIGLDERKCFVRGQHAVSIRRRVRLPTTWTRPTCLSRSSGSTTRRAGS